MRKGGMVYIGVKNWEKFQQYKDGRPLRWIKLHLALQSDYEFSRLPEPTQIHLLRIWLLAAERGNRLPLDPAWIGSQISAQSPVNLEILLADGWLVPLDGVDSDDALKFLSNRDVRNRTKPYDIVSFARSREESREEKKGGSDDPPPETGDVSESEAQDPAEWMHDDWLDAFGGSGRQIDLTTKRRQKYRAMHEERLASEPDPRTAWRRVLGALAMSDHHMSKRAYQLPESFLRSRERRERWMQEAEAAFLGDTPLGEGDRKIVRLRQRMEGWDLTEGAG